MATGQIEIERYPVPVRCVVTDTTTTALIGVGGLVVGAVGSGGVQAYLSQLTAAATDTTPPVCSTCNSTMAKPPSQPLEICAIGKP